MVASAVLGFHVLFTVRACIRVFVVVVSPIRETQGKQVDPQEGCQALRDIIPCFLDCFHHHGSISDEDNGLPNGSTVIPDLVLGTNDSKNHPQCKQHYQEDRSQEDKGMLRRVLPVEWRGSSTSHTKGSGRSGTPMLTCVWALSPPLPPICPEVPCIADQHLHLLHQLKVLPLAFCFVSGSPDFGSISFQLFWIGPLPASCWLVSVAIALVLVSFQLGTVLFPMPQN